MLNSITFYASVCLSMCTCEHTHTHKCGNFPFMLYFIIWSFSNAMWVFCLFVFLFKN